MDSITIVLLLLLSAAFCWWFKIRLDENSALVSELEREEEIRLLREERIRQLTNKL